VKHSKNRQNLAGFTSGPAILLLVAGLAMPALAQPAETKPADPKPADAAPASSPTPAPAPASAPASAPATAPAQPATTPAAAPATQPATAPAAGGAKPEEAKPGTKVEKQPIPRTGPNNRRGLSGTPTVLAFKGVKVEAVIPFIVEATGKVVLPQADVMGRSITVLNDEPIARDRALDLVFLALQQAGVAVVETEDLITLRDINDLPKQDVPVLGPDESTLTRTDLGNVAEKVFSLRYASAENLGTIIKESIPDFAKLNVDKVSNQIVVMGNLRLLQRIERLVQSLDRPSAAALQTETFRLRYADADQVATLIRELFAADTRATGGNQNQNNPFAQIFGGGGRGGNQGGGNQPGGGNQGGNRGGQTGGADPNAVLSSTLRVSANKQQNSVTVVSEKQVIDQVREQINDYWDKPLSEDQVVPKVFDLQYSDAIKVRDILEASFGKGTTTTSGGGGNFGGGGNSTTTPGTGRLAGQFSFQAIPEANRLLVFAKSPDNMDYIERVILDLDKPQTAGLPQIVELKHASAEELAEQLNTLLAQDGTLASIRRAETGLSDSTTGQSPFASSTTDTATNNAATDTGTSSESISFWWQRSRPPTDRRNSSNLIGTIRIVPVWRQNALMVLSPPEYRSAVLDMVQLLDRPGRQVLISAVICEVSGEDATALGLRWSSQTLTPDRGDNSISIGSEAEGTKNDLLPGLFDTSTLNSNINLNLLLQALNEKTKVNILSEPKIFTSDNQEASFFDGKDIPFINDQTVNQVGQTTASFDYKAVGIQLKARPRITVTGDIDLQVNLQLASISPGEVVQGALVVDRRETTTHLILKGGQTVVISGILRKEEQDIVRKIPLLGDIPFLGELFKSREKTITDKELLVFVTPVVVDNTEQLPKANERYIDRLEELRSRLREKEVDTTPDSAGKPVEAGG
jgi:type II secretion system protein D